MPDDTDDIQLHLLSGVLLLLLPQHQQGLLESHLCPGELMVSHGEGVAALLMGKPSPHGQKPKAKSNGRKQKRANSKMMNLALELEEEDGDEVQRRPMWSPWMRPEKQGCG